MNLVKSNQTVTDERLEGSSQLNQTVSCDRAHTYVIITLTFPVWTFITLSLAILLIQYLRRIQYYHLYDKCTPKNAHFRYDFHMVIGRQSLNYNKTESYIIIDLLDKDQVSTMTFQIPGHCAFNDQNVFLYRHSRPNLRCVAFSIYRRHPIKDVKSVRIAHSCGLPDSRLFVHGINLYDASSAEDKFFPISSSVKYRGTQWALNTTFEPKPDGNFTKIGAMCYDPFGISCWPTYFETLLLIFYIWAAVLCFGHLISVQNVLDNIALHALTVIFIVLSSAIFISLIYLRLVKIHIIDQHYNTVYTQVVKFVFITVVFCLSFAFWALTIGQMDECLDVSLRWIYSSLASGFTLTLTLFIAAYIAGRRKVSKDNALLEESEDALIKTASKTNIEYTHESPVGLYPNAAPPSSSRSQTVKIPANKSTGSSNSQKTTGGTLMRPQQQPAKAPAPSARAKSKDREQPAQEGNQEGTPSESGTKYMKNRNKNSIAQYVWIKDTNGVFIYSMDSTREHASSPFSKYSIDIQKRNVEGAGGTTATIVL